MIPLRQRGNRRLRSEAGLTAAKVIWLTVLLGVGCSLVAFCVFQRNRVVDSLPQGNVHTYAVRGTIEKLQPEESSIVVSHDAIGTYMDAMTMPFRVRQVRELAGLQTGDRVTFRLSVTETESWIDHIVKLSGGGHIEPAPAANPSIAATLSHQHHPLLDYPFTNELGQAVTLHSFQGRALAITFFFTRCPIPDFCPRLSKNFAEASRKLAELNNGPTNWHLLSVSFDPEFDTPPVLKTYAEKYQYDPAHWSFLTGPKDKIAELARLSNVQAEPDGGLFNHNFRTIIIDASGRLQMVFPTGGNLSEAIVSELLKGAAAGSNKAS